MRVFCFVSLLWCSSLVASSETSPSLDDSTIVEKNCDQLKENFLAILEVPIPFKDEIEKQKCEVRNRPNFQRNFMDLKIVKSHCSV